MSQARRFYYLIQALRRLGWDRNRLTDYQNRQLRKVVHNAYENVHFYRELFKAKNITPSDIKTTDDLNKIPIITKNDMKKTATNNLISQKYTLQDLHSLKTGGSTGEPVSIYVNKKEDDWRNAIALKANIVCGQKIRDRWIALIDAESAGQINFLRKHLRIYARRTIPVTWNRTKQIEAVAEAKPNVLDGFSGIIWLLAKETELRNINEIKPRIIFGTAESISQSSIKYIERVFHAPYYDQFGASEIGSTAWQCQEQQGYHLNIDSVITQFVDENGEEVSPGESGELVYTSLFNLAMPFIRYNIQDVGTPVDHECQCGLKLPIMKMVEGRSNSFLSFPDGKVIAPMTFIETLQAYRFVKEIDQYRVFQKRRNSIEIQIKKTDKNVDERLLEDKLKTNIYQGLPKVEKLDLSNVDFIIKFVDDLPLEGRGKLNVVHSEVKAMTDFS